MPTVFQHHTILTAISYGNHEPFFKARWNLPHFATNPFEILWPTFIFMFLIKAIKICCFDHLIDSYFSQYIQKINWRSISALNSSLSTKEDFVSTKCLLPFSKHLLTFIKMYLLVSNLKVISNYTIAVTGSVGDAFTSTVSLLLF